MRRFMTAQAAEQSLLMMIGDLRAVEPLLEYASSSDYRFRQIQAGLGYMSTRTEEQREFARKIHEGLKKLRETGSN